MNLNPNDVHIWYISFNKKKLLNLNNLFHILSENEKIKSKSFIQERDQRNYIISHAYLRIILTKYHPNINPRSWIFSKNKYEKPFLSKKHNSNICFNMSHSYSAAAFIFTSSNLCGIDIEDNNKDIYLDEPMINLVLSKEERDLYQLSKNKNALFYRFWTLKEAYFKALGIGISQNITQTNYNSINSIDSTTYITFNQNNYHYGTLFLERVCLSYTINMGISKTFDTKIIFI